MLLYAPIRSRISPKPVSSALRTPLLSRSVRIASTLFSVSISPKWLEIPTALLKKLVIEPRIVLLVAPFVMASTLSRVRGRSLASSDPTRIAYFNFSIPIRISRRGVPSSLRIVSNFVRSSPSAPRSIRPSLRMLERLSITSLSNRPPFSVILLLARSAGVAVRVSA